MKKEVSEWAKIAREDLQASEYLYEKSLFRMVCYHAQQSVEKTLKAILTGYEIEFSRTHNILDLQNAVEKIWQKIPLDDEEAIFLNSVYRSRYPVDLGLLPKGEPTMEDAKKALSLAHKIQDWFTKTFTS